MLEVKVVACGDAFGSNASHNSCYWIKYEGKNYLLDCGALAISNIKKFNMDITAIDAIFLSHLHGDHFGGLAFIFTELAYAKDFNETIKIIGPKGTDQKLEQLQELFYPGSWEKVKSFIEFIDLNNSKHSELPDFEFIRVPHSENLECFGIKLIFGSRILSYSGDLEWTDKIVELSRGADLFICECFSFDQKISGHISYSEIQSNIDILSCKKLVLTHLGQSMLNNLDKIDIHYLKEGEDIIL
jgi:ribonuclease BN (tRNA processing enzyme)